MIVVTMEQNALHIRGHSGYGEPGKDIVCAGVSVLLQSTIKAIQDLTQDKITYDITPGNGVVEFEELSEQGKLLMDSFFVGLCMIAEEFPDNVRLE